MDAVFVALARLHVANFLGSLGYTELAESLRALVSAPGVAPARDAANAARHAADAAPLRGIVGDGGLTPTDGLIGELVTRAGPLRGIAASAADQAILRRLDFRPVFVGLERRFVNAVITGEADLVRNLPLGERRATGAVRTDRAGGWLVRVGEGIAIE
jgi:hypothetical protein